MSVLSVSECSVSVVSVLLFSVSELSVSVFSVLVFSVSVFSVLVFIVSVFSVSLTVDLVGHKFYFKINYSDQASHVDNVKRPENIDTVNCCLNTMT